MATVLGPPDEVPAHLRPEAAAALAMQLLRDLPEGPERHAIWLFHIDGQLTLQQIARGVGTTPATVTAWLERFRTGLKHALLQQQLGARDFHTTAATLEAATDAALAELSSAEFLDVARADAVLERILAAARG